MASIKLSIAMLASIPVKGKPRKLSSKKVSSLNGCKISAITFLGDLSETEVATYVLDLADTFVATFDKYTIVGRMDGMSDAMIAELSGFGFTAQGKSSAILESTPEAAKAVYAMFRHIVQESADAVNAARENGQLQRERDELQTQLTDANSKVAKLEKDLEAAKTELEATKGDLASVREQLAEAQQSDDDDWGAILGLGGNADK